MMLFHRLSIATALMLSLGSSVVLLSQNSVLAQMPDQPGDINPGKGGMTQNLHLTKEQIKQIQAIEAKYKPQLEQKGQAVRQAMEEMRKLMNRASATKEQLRTQHQKAQDLYQEMMGLRFESFLEVRDILTPEQRTKFNQITQSPKGKTGSHPGGGHRGNK